MKIIINESNIKKVFERLNIDLSGKIHMVTNSYEMPMEFERMFPIMLLRVYLNNYGPMYIIQNGGEMYLYQYHGALRPIILIDTDGNHYNELDFLENYLNVPPIGITLQDIVDTFVEEED